eukprot:TRINITY_DN5771_c0_g1_i1.p1 TRINITY_DN5771_c0_g1~~TRINITY_DN5771_c0_g1_i1.p1  ORF type:complete len:374 (-),score=99.25 TRINITY_DN5771_c0_g1_i1:713-1834(-)
MDEPEFEKSLNFEETVSNLSGMEVTKISSPKNRLNVSSPTIVQSPSTYPQSQLALTSPQMITALTEAAVESPSSVYLALPKPPPGIRSMDTIEVSNKIRELTTPKKPLSVLSSSIMNSPSLGHPEKDEMLQKILKRRMERKFGSSELNESLSLSKLSINESRSMLPASTPNEWLIKSHFGEIRSPSRTPDLDTNAALKSSTLPLLGDPKATEHMVTMCNTIVGESRYLFQTLREGATFVMTDPGSDEFVPTPILLRISPDHRFLVWGSEKTAATSTPISFEVCSSIPSFGHIPLSEMTNIEVGSPSERLSKYMKALYPGGTVEDVMKRLRERVFTINCFDSKRSIEVMCSDDSQRRDWVLALSLAYAVTPFES